MNIYQKLLKITEELNTVKKGLTVGSGSYGYKAVGEMDILQAVRPLEIQYGVYSYPMNRVLVSQETLETEKNGKTSTKFMMRVETTYRFVNVDEPSEVVDQVSYGDGVDSLDKSPGKAMTYSDKYSLMKAYKIMTGDDPDQNHSNDTTVKKRNNYNIPKKVNEPNKDAILKGKLEIDKQLDLPANIPYRDIVIKNVCAIYDWKSWDDVTFRDNNQYKKLLSIVSQELDKEKMLAQ